MPDDALETAFLLAPHLLHLVEQRTKSQRGVTRAPYDRGETEAAEILCDHAKAIGLEIKTDFAANLYMVLPGRDRTLPSIVIGSHLDSVPEGGNYDGLAGVVAGLVIAAALAKSGRRLSQDLVVMGIRAEESAWFGTQHIGSRAALGLLTPTLLDNSRRFDSDRTLSDHMEAAGVDTASIKARRAWLTKESVRAYFELHIEQGPVLQSQKLAVGLVTAIRGNLRCSEIRCRGEYGHSGAVPHGLRRDAVVGATSLVGEMERYWNDIEARGEDIVLTFGRFFTNPQLHNLTTIPGELTFSFDARSSSTVTLDAIKEKLESAAGGITERTGVEFIWRPFSQTAPALMDANLRSGLVSACERLGVPAILLPSGAGHDAQDFVEAGIPSAMIFVRNANGSHNPDEHLEMDDLRAGTRVLFEALYSLD